MGQQIAVVATPSSTPGVLRFEANRNLTGMGHETFRAADEVRGAKPAAALARSLFATGRVDAVHVYGNIITVDLRKGHSGDGLDDVVRDLYQYWKPGMEPPAFDDMVATEAPAAAAATGGEGGGADSVYLQRVPAHLVERSRAALAKWRATH
ncbi:MAG: hypothetical protein ACKO27_12455 [Ilumatobacteraceae bacterium]